jgi:hypothetical protein
MSIRKIAIAVSLLLALASCDDNDDNAASQGGGSGSSDPNNVTATPGAGFCAPTGGAQALGASSFNSGVTVAKIDTDGNPAEQGLDPDWQPGTSGSVNGQAVNSAQYSYVVMSPGQMRNDGVSLGDWATVTNTATGQTTYARVEDRGPAGGTGEISQAAASAVGISYLPSSATVGNPTVDVQAYAGTSAIQDDCSGNTANNS